MEYFTAIDEEGNLGFINRSGILTFEAQFFCNGNNLDKDIININHILQICIIFLQWHCFESEYFVLRCHIYKCLLQTRSPYMITRSNKNNMVYT